MSPPEEPRLVLKSLRRSPDESRQMQLYDRPRALQFPPQRRADLGLRHSHCIPDAISGCFGIVGATVRAVCPSRQLEDQLRAHEARGKQERKGNTGTNGEFAPNPLYRGPGRFFLVALRGAAYSIAYSSNTIPVL